MGQDREFSADEKRFALTVIQSFIKNWERAEVASLKADRDARVEIMSRDPTIEQEATQATLEAIDKTVEELVTAEGKEYEDDEKREIDVGQYRLQTTGKAFNGGDFQ